MSRIVSDDALIPISVAGGVEVLAPPSTGFMSTYILVEQEDWFEAEIGFVRALLRPGERAIDVGANLGVYSTAMAKAVGPQGAVWSFEPTPATAWALASTLDRNGFRQARLVQAAVGDRHGTMRLTTHPNAEVNYLATTSAAEGEEVSVGTLDGYAAEFGWRGIDFVKIDVEGHEAPVLAGAEELLASDSPLIMAEISVTPGGKARLTAELARQGLSTYRHVPGLDVLLPYEFATKETPPYCINLFACRTDRAAALAARDLLVTHSPAMPAPPPLSGWERWLAAKPFAPAMLKATAAERKQTSERNPYLKALAEFAAAHDPSLPLPARSALLVIALRRMRALVADDPSPARRCTLARIAWEAGDRATAIAMLQALIDRSAMGLVPAEPFIPPAPRYDDIDPGTEIAAWLRSAVIEQHERLRLFSSYFLRGETIDRLQALVGNPFASPEMERRLHLMQARFNRRTAPQPSPLLCAARPDNRNPAIWRGETGLRFA